MTLINDKRWYWCDTCGRYVWSDGNECPARHFATLTLEEPETREPAAEPQSPEEAELEALYERGDMRHDEER